MNIEIKIIIRLTKRTVAQLRATAALFWAMLRLFGW
jgi:hypothetical protein